jgi:hypothetical protein
MYTRIQFGKELKQKILDKIGQGEIGEWAHSMYMENIEEIDLDFRSFLIALGTMGCGEEFYYSFEELDLLADRLVAGEDVKL